ncbi:MAG: glycosyltransferase family 2 protein, partial [Acidobacteria bacterium]|nr:glycosyltransferase family 2 protein [Acidobacteriota bacterium]
EITARLLRLGYQIYEVAVRYDARSRRQGKKIRWRDGVRALQVLLRERLR